MGHKVSKHDNVRQNGLQTQQTRGGVQEVSGSQQIRPQPQTYQQITSGSQQTQSTAQSSSSKPSAVVRKPIPTAPQPPQPPHPQQPQVRSVGTQTDTTRITENCGPMGEGMHSECKTSTTQTQRSIQTPPDPTFGYTANKEEDFESLKNMGFEVDCELGEGMVGTVYGGHYNEKIVKSIDRYGEHLRHVKTGEKFALKYVDLASNPYPDEQYMDRVFLERERKTLCVVNHKNVLPSKMIVHLGTQNWIKYKGKDGGFWSPDRIAVIMDRADKGDLLEYISKHNNCFTESLVKNLCYQLGEGLVYLHTKNIVHGDIKASNVLMFTENGRLVPKLCDFGLSQITSHTYEPYIGSPQAVNDAKVDDVKCLAKVFETLLGTIYDKLSNKPVAGEDSPKALVDNLLQHMKAGSIYDVTQHQWFKGKQPYDKKLDQCC